MGFFVAVIFCEQSFQDFFGGGGSERAYFFLSSFFSFVSKYIFTCSLSGLRLGIHLKHIYNGSGAKICFWLSETNQAPWSWGVGEERKRYGLLKGSGTETDFWVLPTEEALQPQGLPLLTDPTAHPRPLLINFPAALQSFRVEIPHLVEQYFLDILASLKGKRRGVGRGPQAPSPPPHKKKASPHTENTAAEDEKHFIVQRVTEICWTRAI